MVLELQLSGTEALKLSVILFCYVFSEKSGKYSENKLSISVIFA